MVKLFFRVALLCMLLPLLSEGQQPAQTIPLWPNGAPGFENRRNEPEEAKDYWVKHIHNPSLTVYLPQKEKANGTAVIVCAGGGHRLLVYNSEGRDPAVFLNTLGITVFVLKYRLAREEGSPYTLPTHSQQDAYRAIRLVRSRAKQWNLDPDKIGMLGFSAGGEVVSFVAYAPAEGKVNSSDPVERVSGKPDFQMLIYPGPLGIPDSVPKDAPPAFMLAANDDTCCSPPVLSLLSKYRQAKRPVEAHLLTEGGHGFNMGYRSTSPTVKGWPNLMALWLADRGYISTANLSAVSISDKKK